jgi:hypothetical protein
MRSEAQKPVFISDDKAFLCQWAKRKRNFMDAKAYVTKAIFTFVIII